MNERKGYGISVRNTIIDIRDTVAYQELSSLGLDDIVIDIVRGDSNHRPELERLIATLGPGDIIDIYSIDVFLQGRNGKSVDYYRALLEKGIDLLIYDFSGAVARISRFATLRFGDVLNGEDFFVRKQIDCDEYVSSFEAYIKRAKSSKNSGNKKTEERLSLSPAFKEIYFAYESYQLSQKLALELLDEYCGIKNKITFWLMALDYERTLGYEFELQNYAISASEILELPKRCGSVPDEYYEILKQVEVPNKKSIDKAMELLGMAAGYDVFHRWELAAQKIPKPRRGLQLGFSLEKFRETYTPIQNKTGD